MYLGLPVEIGSREAIFAAPQHPYTRALLSATPVADPAAQARAHPAEGRAAVADHAAERLRFPSALSAGLRPLPRGGAAARAKEGREVACWAAPPWRGHLRLHRRRRRHGRLRARQPADPPIRATACCCSRPAAGQLALDPHPGRLSLRHRQSAHRLAASRPTAEPGLNGRALNYPRGKVLGGCSSINGMIYMRGQARDYDGWRQLGHDGWGWDDVLPYFKRHEDHSAAADATPARQRRRMAGRARRASAGTILDAFRDAGGGGRHPARSTTSTAATTRASAISRSTSAAACAGARRKASCAPVRAAAAICGW